MSEPPKLATALPRRIVANQPALVGDLLEQFRLGRSRWWYWQQVLALLGCRSWRELRASAWWSAAAITAAVLVLDLPYLFHSPVPVDARQWLLMALFLAPQALVIAVPVGLTVGMVFGARSRVSSRSLPVVLMFAISASLLTFAIAGWVVPASNQAYRFAAVQWKWHPMRGAAERNLVELHSLMGGASASWDVAVSYYARFAVSCSPMAFALFGVWAATLGGVTRRLLVVATAGAYVALFLVVDLQQARAFPPFIVAWFPTMSIAAIALLVRWCAPERQSPTSQTS
jgi:hypothetical protein